MGTPAHYGCSGIALEVSEYPSLGGTQIHKRAAAHSHQSFGAFQILASESYAHSELVIFPGHHTQLIS